MGTYAQPSERHSLVSPTTPVHAPQLPTTNTIDLNLVSGKPQTMPALTEGVSLIGRNIEEEECVGSSFAPLEAHLSNNDGRLRSDLPSRFRKRVLMYSSTIKVKRTVHKRQLHKEKPQYCTWSNYPPVRQRAPYVL